MGEELEHECLFADSALFRLQRSEPGHSNPYVHACASVWHDLASAPSRHPTESESELSVSGFLSVASHSCEEDEGRDTPLLSSLRHPSALRGPAGMSGEGNHGNQPAQHNGVKKHRWDMLQL